MFRKIQLFKKHHLMHCLSNKNVEVSKASLLNLNSKKLIKRGIEFSKEVVN